jgi:vacuolar-type H+-ATPase subunit E/Vma4
MKGYKTGGRTKGAPNKITNEIRKKLKNIVDNELDILEETLKHLESKERLELLIKLIPYVIPKVQTVSSKEGEPIDLFEF